MPNSGLLGLVKKPLVALGPMPGHALHRAIRRHGAHRPEYGTRVPLQVLDEALKMSPFIDSQGDRFRWADPDASVQLHALEKEFLDIIDEIGPVVTFNSFRIRLEAIGWKPVTVSLHLRTSTILDSPSRGMYHVLAADVVPSDFEHARTVAPPRGYRKR